MVINLLNYITMKKIFALLIVATTLFSCSKTESPIFDGQRRITYFVASSAQLPVVLNEGGTVSRNIVSSELSDVDRTVEIELVSATLEDPNAFTFTEVVTIPAGEYVGTFTVNGFSVDELTTNNELVVFRIAAASDGSDLNGSLQQLEVQMRLVCPVPTDYFVGSYFMEQTSTQENPFFGNFGRSFTSQDVEVQLVENSATSRFFEFSYFGSSFQSPYFMELELSCGEFETFGTILPGNGTLGCGGGSIGVLSPPNLSDFVISDGDDVITLDVFDFAQTGGCNVTPYVVTLQFTKQ